MRYILLGTAMVLALGASPGQAAPLQANRAGSCTLGGGVALAIKAALVIANASQQRLGLDARSLSVDSIVIRSAVNPDGGQRLAGASPRFTGAIVCTFDAGLLPPAVPYAIQPTSAAAPILDIDLRASQVNTWVQYARNPPSSKTENLICLSTRNNNDCFSIFPKGSR